jgi:WD40 repeat protein
METSYSFSSFGSFPNKDMNQLGRNLGNLSLEESSGLFEEVRRDDFGPHKKGVWRILPISSSQVVTACYDHMARIFNVDDKDQVQSNNPLILTAHKREVLSLVCQGNTIITGSSDGQMFFWDKDTGEMKKNVIREPKKETRGFYSLALLANNKIATGACQKPNKIKPHEQWDHNIKIWDLSSGKQLAEMKGHEGGIASLEVVENLLISGSGDKSIRLWDINKKTIVSTCEKAHDDYIYSIAPINDTLLASGSKDRKIKIWDLETGQIVQNLCMGSESCAHLSTVYSVAAYQENFLLSGGRDGFAKIWDRRTGKSVGSLDTEGRFVYSVAGLEKNRIAAGLDVSKENSDSDQCGLRVWEFRF